VSLRSAGERITVFAVFAALAAAAAAAVIAAPPAAAPTSGELAAQEARMVLAARLHVAAAVPAPAGSAPWCAECHQGPAHPGSGVSPAMLNAHAARMDCLLCHWPAAAGSLPAPAWQVLGGTAMFLSVSPRERLSRERLTALRSTATVTRRCFERGSPCAGCHRPGGLGSVARPGSAAGHTASLERLERYFALAPGEKWYFAQTR
jgi:hypothetical protein